MYRVALPQKHLTRVDKDLYVHNIPFIPNSLEQQNQEHYLINILKNFDLVIIQRCYIYAVVSRLRKACDFLGIPLIFETDDDYLNLESHNPCYHAMVPNEKFQEYRKICISGDIERAKEKFLELESHRAEGLNQYKEIIRMVDGVTVSTPELGRTLYPYNKNIKVLENNVDCVYPWRDNECENNHYFTNEKGRQVVKIEDFCGLWTIPNWKVNDKLASYIPRVGYSGTPSHRGNDFNTIKSHFFQLMKKYKDETWMIYIGDPYFASQHPEGGRIQHIHATEYNLYMMNLRNIDIGLAPLEATIFNQSKSDIKACEYASFGGVPVLPNYVTYNRHWVNRETAMMYNNADEMYDCIEELLKSRKLRVEIGENARTYIQENRLEEQHSQKRYDFYQGVINQTPKLNVYKPIEKEVVNV